jgi:GNAT superfamily N-acetyltransferase
MITAESWERKTMDIRVVDDGNEKQQITRLVLEALPDWFGVSETRENYIKESAGLPLIAAFDEGKPVGFLCLKETGRDTMEIHVMGVLMDYHRAGIGKAMFQRAKEVAVDGGYSFMQVKTVQMGLYEDYDRTNQFYRALGFKEFEVLPTLWDELNPCQIYVMSLR